MILCVNVAQFAAPCVELRDPQQFASVRPILFADIYADFFAMVTSFSCELSSLPLQGQGESAIGRKALASSPVERSCVVDVS